MNKPLRIGLIGAGMVSRHHLIAWADIAEHARVIAIADAEAMFAASELDAVDIAAPRQFHAPRVRLAAKHRLPVLCQKPLVPDLQHCYRLSGWEAAR
jgi:D-apiose dehydrogenase